ncbi:hypothetical protein BKH46_08405 [Helicobacter sp. 12S02634-8]|nr:hypothetical protein BKH46_08405 [Helicobacter sp. 12S02634-8]
MVSLKKTISFKGLSKLFFSRVQNNSSSVINDLLLEALESGRIYNILLKYFSRAEIEQIRLELENEFSFGGEPTKNNIKTDIDKVNIDGVKEKYKESESKIISDFDMTR